MIGEFLALPVRTKVWLGAAGLVGLLAIAGCAGILAHSAFLQFSVLKWALTIGGPLVVLLLLFSRRPGLWACGLMILVIPVAPFVASVGTFQISVLFAATALATVTVMLEGAVRSPSAGPLPALVVVTPLLIACSLVPIFRGDLVTHQLLYLALFVDIVWICLRTAANYPEGRTVITLAFIGMAALQGSAAVYEYVTGHRIDLYGGAGQATYAAQSYFFEYGHSARTSGTFFDPISLGNVLAMALPLALVLVLRRAEVPWVRVACLISLVPILAGIVVALSRASWIAATLAVLCVVLFSRGSQRLRALVLVVAVGVAAVVTVQSVYGPLVTTRFASIFHPTAAGVSTAKGDTIRQEQWHEAERLFSSNVVGGVGFGNLAPDFEAKIAGLDSTTHAQNVYLQYLAEGGLFGGAVLVLLAGGVVVDLRRGRRRDPLYPGLVGASVGVAATWVTDYTVRYFAVAGCFAVLLGLIASGGSVASPATPIGEPVTSLSEDVTQPAAVPG